MRRDACEWVIQMRFLLNLYFCLFLMAETSCRKRNLYFGILIGFGQDETWQTVFYSPQFGTNFIRGLITKGFEQSPLRLLRLRCIFLFIKAYLKYCILFK